MLEENEIILDDGIINDNLPIPYFMGLRNTMIKVVHLWQPVAKYRMIEEPQKAVAGVLSPIRMEIDQRQGLSITLKTSNGSYQEIRVKCTDSLWDDIMNNQVYKFIDDDIYLKFDENGVAYEYLITDKSNRNNKSKDIESMDEFYRTSRTKFVKDVLLQNLKNNPEIASGGSSGMTANQPVNNTDSYLGNTVVFEVTPVTTNDGKNVLVKMASSKVNKKDIEDIRRVLDKKVKDREEIKELDFVEGKLIGSIRENGRYIYVDFSE